MTVLPELEYTPRRSRIPGLNGSPDTGAQPACSTRVYLRAGPGMDAPIFRPGSLFRVIPGMIESSTYTWFEILGSPRISAASNADLGKM